MVKLAPIEKYLRDRIPNSILLEAKNTSIRREFQSEYHTFDIRQWDRDGSTEYDFTIRCTRDELEASLKLADGEIEINRRYSSIELALALHFLLSLASISELPTVSRRFLALAALVEKIQEIYPEFEDDREASYQEFTQLAKNFGVRRFLPGKSAEPIGQRFISALIDEANRSASATLRRLRSAPSSRDFKEDPDLMDMEFVEASTTPQELARGVRLACLYQFRFVWVSPRFPDRAQAWTTYAMSLFESEDEPEE